MIPSTQYYKCLFSLFPFSEKYDRNGPLQIVPILGSQMAMFNLISLIVATVVVVS